MAQDTGHDQQKSQQSGPGCIKPSGTIYSPAKSREWNSVFSAMNIPWLWWSSNAQPVILTQAKEPLPGLLSERDITRGITLAQGGLEFMSCPSSFLLGLQETLGHHAWLPVCFLKIGCVLFASCPTYSLGSGKLPSWSEHSHQKRGPLCPWTPPVHKNGITTISPEVIFLLLY